MSRRRRPRPAKLPVVVEQLVRKRRQANLSRVDLAHGLGYCHNTVQMWETGRINPTFQSLLNWCDFFGVTLTVTERSND